VLVTCGRTIGDATLASEIIRHASAMATLTRSRLPTYPPNANWARVSQFLGSNTLVAHQTQDVAAVLVGESAEFADGKIEWGQNSHVEDSRIDTFEPHLLSNPRAHPRA
jgi:hypothetical protein